MDGRQLGGGDFKKIRMKCLFFYRPSVDFHPDPPDVIKKWNVDKIPCQVFHISQHPREGAPDLLQASRSFWAQNVLGAAHKSNVIVNNPITFNVSLLLLDECPGNAASCCRGSRCPHLDFPNGCDGAKSNPNCS